MGISRAISIFAILAFGGSSVLAQLDPRTSGGAQSGFSAIQPWLAVSGSYYTDVNAPAGASNPPSENVGLNGGLAMKKSFKRTVFSLGYSGAVSRYFTKTGSPNEWNPSNVVSLSL